MNKTNLTLLVVFFVAILSTPSLFAQSRNDGFDQMDGYLSFEIIKADVATLMIENQKLEARYDKLNTKLNSLRTFVQSQKKAISELNQDGKQVFQDRHVKNKSIDYLKENYENMQDNYLVKESKNSYMQGEILDLEEGATLWQLRLADLDYRKRELLMELKYKEYIIENAQRNQQSVVDELKEKLQYILEQEQKVNQRISQIKKNTSSFPETIHRLSRENNKLGDEVDILEQKKYFQDKENNILKDKKLLIAKSTGKVLENKEVEKDQLKEVVTRLENEYQNLNEKVNASLNQQDNKKKLLQGIILLDEENRDLKKMIQNLEEKIKEFE